MAADLPLSLGLASWREGVLHAVWINLTSPLTGALFVVGAVLLYGAYRSCRLPSWIGRAAMTLTGSLGLLFVAASQFGLPFAVNNAMLGSLQSTQFSAVTRLGFYKPGDVPSLTYIASPNSCPLNSGTGDNGSQVKSLDGGCWLAAFPRSGVDPRQFGAAGNQASDDSAAIQAAIAYVETAGSGIVLFPAGNYCVKAAGLSVSTPYVRLVGVSNAVEIQTCGANVAPITINARRDTVEHLTVAGCCFGPGAAGLGATTSTIVMGSACTECLLDDVYAAGGQTVILDQATDDTINNVFASQAYGSAILLVQGLDNNQPASAYCVRCKFDQIWPVSTPAYGSSFVPWASCTVYPAGTVVSTGGYYIQNTNGGKTGYSAPSLANYGVAINDNAAGCAGGSNAIWQLVAATNYASVYFARYGGPYFEINSDHTGPFNYAFSTDTGAGGASPQNITLVDSVCGAVILACFYAHDGGNLMIRGGTWSNCIAAGCQGLSTSGNWRGDVSVTGITMFGLGYGVYDATGQCFSGGSPAVCSTATTLRGSGLTVADSIIGSSHVAALYAASIAGGVVGFNWSNNILNSGVWGGNPIGAQVAGPSSDYYTIVNNFCGGAANCVSDAGTGRHKTVSGNY